MDEVFEIAAEFGTTIWGMDSQIIKKTRDLMDLNREIAKKQEELKKLIERCGLTADELEIHRLSKLQRKNERQKNYAVALLDVTEICLKE